MRSSNVQTVFASLIILIFSSINAAAATDPLPSWQSGQSKQSIINYVEKVISKDSRDYIAESDRIAVFDNDGTLWSEKPFYFQLAFALDRVKTLAPLNPKWQKDPILKAAIDNDLQTVFAGGEHALIKLVMATHGGMTTVEFEKIINDWITTARHPTTDRLYTEMVFQPMLELLDYLRDNGFKTYIVSGGGIEFMRPWAEKVYGIPPEQVIGSSIKVKFENSESGPVLRRMPEVDFIDDKADKPVAIHKFIGKRPVFAFGNSDGDHQMLQWTDASSNLSFQGLVHHTDSAREWAYDRDSSIGRLDKAMDEAKAKGWTMVDMKKEWKTIYPPLNN